MELRPRQGVCTAAAVVVVLLAGCCFEGTHGTRRFPQLQPRPQPGIVFPYFCPLDVTLSKLKINQSESGYVQYTEYATKMPSLTSFTMHYWFNLADDTTTSTMFQYGAEPFDRNDYLSVQLEVDKYGTQYWSVKMDGALVSRVQANPPIRKGEWHHALHTWNLDSLTISHFIDGNLLESQRFYKSKTYHIPGGGVAVSGQHQNTALTMGMDQGEGLNGWFTLFHLSSKPLDISTTSDAAITKAKLAFQCSGDMESDLISWTTTPRKGYGGVTETPSYSKACGRF